MNIVILADSFPPYICGVTTHTVELSRKLIRRGHHLLIFAPRYPESPPLPEEFKKARMVDLNSIPTPYQNLRICTPSFYRIAKELHSFHPTLFYAQTPSILSIESQQFAKLFSIPFIASFHTLYASDAYLELIFRTKYAKKLQPATWTILRWFYNASDQIIVPTPSIKTHVLAHRFEKNKVSVLPSLFDIETVKVLSAAQKERIKKKYRLKKNVAGFVGRLTIDKGIDKLLKIWSRVIKEVPDATLLLVGGAGSYQKEIDTLIKKYRLKDHVLLTGAIAHSKLLSSGLLSVLDVFVSASTTETFGLSMVECMACGIQVVIPRAQGMKDIVGDAGIVCNGEKELARTLVKILTDDAVRLERGREAQQVAQKYGGETGVDLYLKEFKKVIAKHQKNK